MGEGGGAKGGVWHTRTENIKHFNGMLSKCTVQILSGQALAT
jgi:hypothetical protein